eukprot:175063_1
MLFIILTSLLAQTFAQSCDDMDSLYPGHWTLVRHSYWQWFQSTDSLAGTDIYGTYDNNPQSIQSWSIQFDDQLSDDGSTLFMFTNGDCTQWMVTENNQFLTESQGAIPGTILASHLQNTPYQTDWLVRGISNPEDPWISFKNHGDDDFATNMYSENAVPNSQPCDQATIGRCQRWDDNPNSDKSLNVWIQTESRDCTLVAIDDFLLECSNEWDSYNDFRTTTVNKMSVLEADIQDNIDDIKTLQAAVNKTDGDLAAAISTFQTDINDMKDSINGISIFGAQGEGRNVDGLMIRFHYCHLD